VIPRPAISSDGSKIYVLSEDGDIHAINSTDGSFLWTRSHDSVVQFAGPTLSRDGSVLYASSQLGGNESATSFQSFSAENGTRLSSWNTPWGGFVPRVNPVVSQSGDDVYFLDPFLGVIKFGAGAISFGPQWSAMPNVTEGSRQSVNFQPVLSPDESTIYATVGSYVMAVATFSGEVLWQSLTYARASATPLLSSDGTTLYTTHRSSSYDLNLTIWNAQSGGESLEPS
jgi:hypothetical protein